MLLLLLLLLGPSSILPVSPTRQHEVRPEIARLCCSYSCAQEFPLFGRLDHDSVVAISPVRTCLGQYGGCQGDLFFFGGILATIPHSGGTAIPMRRRKRCFPICVYHQVVIWFVAGQPSGSFLGHSVHGVVPLSIHSRCSGRGDYDHPRQGKQQQHKGSSSLDDDDDDAIIGRR